MMREPRGRRPRRSVSHTTVPRPEAAHKLSHTVHESHTPCQGRRPRCTMNSHTVHVAHRQGRGPQARITVGCGERRHITYCADDACAKRFSLTRDLGEVICAVCGAGSGGRGAWTWVRRGTNHSEGRGGKERSSRRRVERAMVIDECL